MNAPDPTPDQILAAQVIGMAFESLNERRVHCPPVVRDLSRLAFLAIRRDLNMAHYLAGSSDEMQSFYEAIMQELQQGPPKAEPPRPGLRLIRGGKKD